MAELTDLFSLYQFPTGRRIFALRRVAEAAKARGDDAVAARAAEAVEHDVKARALELRFAGREPTNNLYPPGTPAVDAQLDRALGALGEVLASQAGAFGADSERGRAAARVRAHVFPRGVHGITSLTYVEEHETVSAVLPALSAGGALAKDVQTLQLQAFVERIAELNALYGAKIGGAKQGVEHDDVRKAQAQGQRRMLQVVARIVGTHDGDEDDAVAAREALLAPVLEQNAAIRAHRRNRRAPTDVDPDTGEEVVGATTPPVEGD